MADNKKTVQIEFTATGYSNLVSQLRAIAKSSEELIRKNDKLNKINKKIPLALNKMTMDLKELGSSFKKAGVDVKLLKRAYDGHKTSIEKVRRATNQHIRTLKGLSVQTAKASSRTRILGGTFAVVRSKLLLFNFMMSLGIRQLVRFGESASKVESMERAFNTLTGGTEVSTQAISKLQEATNNTMSQFDLFQQANNAMVLGVSRNSDEMAEMFDIAQRLGRALGRDTASSVESLITGIGRQSRLMLDNIGIIVKADEAYESYAEKIGTTADKLSDAQKKQAFLEATMESARAKIKTLGEETLTSQDSYDKLSASASDLATELGTALQPLLTSVAEKLGFVADHTTRLLKTNNILSKSYSDLTTHQERAEHVQAQITANELELASAIRVTGEARVFELQRRKKIEEETKKLRELLPKIEKVVNDEVQRGIELANKKAEELRKEEEQQKKNKEAEDARRIAIEKANKAIADGLTQLDERQKAFFDFNLAFERMKNTTIDFPIEKVEQLNEGFKQTSVSLEFLSDGQRFALKGMDAIGDALAQATLNSQNFGEALVNSLKSVATQLISNYATYALLDIFSAGTFSNTTSFLKFAGFAHTGGYIKEDKTIQRFATGGVVQGEDNVPIMAQAGEFIMSRNAVQSIGIDNLAQMNQTGNAGITLNISAPLVDETVVDSIIPAIEKAKRMNLA
jgi:hypothetical protein